MSERDVAEFPGVDSQVDFHLAGGFLSKVGALPAVLHEVNQRGLSAPKVLSQTIAQLLPFSLDEVRVSFFPLVEEEGSGVEVWRLATEKGLSRKRARIEAQRYKDIVRESSLDEVDRDAEPPPIRALLRVLFEGEPEHWLNIPIFHQGELIAALHGCRLDGSGQPPYQWHDKYCLKLLAEALTGALAYSRLESKTKQLEQAAEAGAGDAGSGEGRELRAKEAPVEASDVASSEAGEAAAAVASEVLDLTDESEEAQDISRLPAASFSHSEAEVQDSSTAQDPSSSQPSIMLELVDPQILDDFEIEAESPAPKPEAQRIAFLDGIISPPLVGFFRFLQEQNYALVSEENLDDLSEGLREQPPSCLLTTTAQLNQYPELLQMYRLLPANEQPVVFELNDTDPDEPTVRLLWQRFKSEAMPESFWRQWLEKTRPSGIEPHSLLALGLATEAPPVLGSFFCGSEYQEQAHQSPVDGIQALYTSPPELMMLRLSEPQSSWVPLFVELGRSARTIDIPVLLFCPSPIGADLKQVLEPITYLQLTALPKII